MEQQQQQQQKFFVVYYEDYFEYEMLERKIFVTASKEEALEQFNKLRSHIIEELNKYWCSDWEEEDKLYEHIYERWPDGEWGTSHYYLQMVNVNAGELTSMFSNTATFKG